MRDRRGDEEAVEDSAEKEDESGGVSARITKLSPEAAVKEEEAAEGLVAALEMEVEEERGSKGEEEGGGNQRALGVIEFLTQEAETSVTTLVDASNGFNELSRLAMLWTVQHRWPAGARFVLSCYRNCAQLLLHQLGEPPLKILSREGVTPRVILSQWYYTGSPSSTWKRSTEQRIRGFSPPSTRMTRLLMVWRNVAHSS